MTEAQGAHLRQDVASPRDERRSPWRAVIDLPRPALIGIAIAIVAFMGYLDIITGPEISVEFGYLIPVILAAWFVGRMPGYLTAAISVGVWLFADIYGSVYKSSFYVAFLNAGSRFCFFVLAVALIAAFRDMSTRLQMLVNERTLELRRLASQLSEAEDSERRRLAYDIHDGFSQILSLLKMNLAAALPQTGEVSAEKARIGEAINMVDDLIVRSRTLTFDLHPAMLDHLGLVPTLHRYADQFGRRANVEVIVSEDGPTQPLAAPIANYLFRSVKELFSNAARHGRAGQIVAAIHWARDQLRIVVDDDGSGFDADTAFATGPAKGLGLAGLRERLLSLGGNLRIESTPGQGTRVVVEVPLQHQELAT